MFIFRHEIMSWMPASNDKCSLWFLVRGRALLVQITIQRRLAVLDRIPPIISTPLGVSTMFRALLQCRHKELHLQKIVLPQRTIDVIRHPFGATAEQITEFSPFFVLHGVVLIVATLPILQQEMNAADELCKGFFF